MSEWYPWDFWVLNQFRYHASMCLKDIYAGIEDAIKAGLLPPQLLHIEHVPGEPPKYKHRVRSTLNTLENRKMVEHLEKGKTGMYRITDAGLKRLDKVEP